MVAMVAMVAMLLPKVGVMRVCKTNWGFPGGVFWHLDVISWDVGYVWICGAWMIGRMELQYEENILMFGGNDEGNSLGGTGFFRFHDDGRKT